MSDRPTPILAPPIVGWGVILLCLLLVLAMAVQVPTLGAGHTVLDFDAFYIAGQMAQDGNIAAAYDKATMLARQSELAGQEIWMPWAYPPQFDLIALGLSWIPRGLSYGLFMLATFVPYVLILRRISGPYLPDLLLLGLPAFLINAAVGQNGFLTGMLMGLFVLGWLRNGRWAGLPLGLMVIKPHLALGAGVLALVSGRWRVVFMSLAVIAASSALATWVLGAGVWRAFLDGTAVASAGMKLGYYPMYRMTSVYAALTSFGLASGVALGAQILMAVASLAVVLRASRMGWPPVQVLGVTLIASMGVSPYNYDYDIPILILGLSLLLPALAPGLGRWGQRGLFLFAWLCGGWGQFAGVLLNPHIPGTRGVDAAISLGVIGQLGLLVLVWCQLRQTAPRRNLSPVAA